MLATVGLVALALGVVGGLVINGGDEKTRTVHSGVRTVVATAPEPATTSVGVTVTQPVRTVERTVTAPPVTVTVPPQTDTTDTTAP